MRLHSIYRSTDRENVKARPARALPEAGYLALYATVGLEMPTGEPLHPGLRRSRPRRRGAWRIGPHEWRASLVSER